MTGPRRFAPITMADPGDHDAPNWVITMAGIRTLCIYLRDAV
jgi:hypothetical protein